MTNIQKAATFSFLLALFSIPFSTTAGEILIYLAFLLSLFSRDWSARLQHIKNSPHIWVIWGFASILLLGLFYGPASLHLKWHIFSKTLWLFLLPIFIVSLSPSLLEKYTIPVFLTQNTLILCLSYIQLTGLIHIHGQGAAVFNGHIVQAIFFSFACYFCINKTLNEKPYRWLYAILAMGFAINILFFNTGRTGYLLLPFILVFFCWQQWGLKKMLLPALLIIIAALTIHQLSPTAHKRTSLVFTNTKTYLDTGKGENSTSMGIRLRDAKIIAWTAKQRPLLGYGSGGIPAGAKAYIAKHHKKPLPYYDPLTDSDYLNMLGQYGFIGLAAFIFFIGFLCHQSRQLTGDQKRMIQMLLLSCIVLSIVFTWLTNVTLRTVLLVFFTYGFSQLIKKQER